MKWYLINLAYALDQLINALFGGWCDETMSSHAYRLHRDGKSFGWLMGVYDTIFFWQDSHCDSAYHHEMTRYQFPPEMR